jgi:hypothetical protein
MLVALWIIVSVPVYISAKVVTNGRAKFIQAMGATVLGPIVYVLVLFVVTIVLGAIVGGVATLAAVLLALLAWLGVFKSSFNTGWLAALGIAALAIAVFIVASFIINFAVLAFMPGMQQPVLPTPFQQA